MNIYMGNVRKYVKSSKINNGKQYFIWILTNISTPSAAAQQPLPLQ